MAKKTRYPPVTIDMDQFKLHVRLKDRMELNLLFNSPSRRFYLSVIALVVNEMKKLGKIASIPLAEHHELLALLNDTIGESAGVSEKENLLPRIYRKWQQALPNLEEAPLFKVIGKKKEYEEGGGKAYPFTDVEKDGWANLFDHKGSERNVRLKFAVDKIGVGLKDVDIIYKEIPDGDAWERFVSDLRDKESVQPGKEEVDEVPEETPAPVPVKWISSRPIRNRWAIGIAAIGLVVAAALMIRGLQTRETYQVEIIQAPPEPEVASIGEIPLSLPDRPSIAVLPFKNMSGDPEQEYIAEGICESIITALCKIPEMFVIARTSTSTYKGKPVKIKQVSEELGVRYVLEGSVQKAGDRIRVTAQLIDAITGHHLWADRYDRDLGDFFDVLDEISRHVAIELQVKLTEGDAARISQKTKNFEAWGHVTTAYSLFRYPTKENITRARELSEKAIKLDPEYGFAWGVVGAAHWVDALLGYSESRDKSIALGFQCVDKSLVLDETLPCAMSVKARLYMLQGQFEQAIALGEKAIALGPSQDLPYFIQGYVMGLSGRFDEAIALIKKAMRLNPIYPPHYSRILGANLFLVGRYDEAVKESNKAIELNQKFGGPVLLDHLYLSAGYMELGKEQEGRNHAAEVMRINPKFTLGNFRKVLVYKDPAHAERFLSALRNAGLPEGE